MKPETRKFIGEPIGKSIIVFRFCNKRLKSPGSFICYKEDKPCHNLSEDELNCFFCYCHEYKTDVEKGGCKIDSPDGKWLFREELPAGKIWDCSDCVVPHQEDVVRKHLRELFGVK